MGCFRALDRGSRIGTGALNIGTFAASKRYGWPLTLNGPVTAAVLMIIISLSPTLAWASPYAEATLLGFTFTFEGKTYDPHRNESTWSYTVTGPMFSGSTYKDLSHWIMALCTLHEVKDASGNDWERRSNPDPHHGLIGIKWDDEVSKNESRSFYFVLEGDWAIDLTVNIAAKAGTLIESGMLPGPSCQPEPPACRIDYDITTRSDWRFLKPGTYAASVFQIQLSGASAVRVGFSDFLDAEYVADWSVSPPIRFDYSIGSTLAAADTFGWRSAAAFNDLEVVIPRHEVQAGTRVNVWMRAVVSETNRSSEYRGGGRIRIVPLC